MNKINFVKTNFTGSKRSARPIVLSVVLLVATTTVISYVQIKQWKTLARVKEQREFHAKHVASFDKELEENNRLNKEHEQLSKKLSKINRVQNNPHRYFSLFASINEALGTSSRLESLNLFRKKLELSISCPDIKQATRFMQNITELPSITSLNLISIQPGAQGFVFKITGVLSPESVRA